MAEKEHDKNSNDNKPIDKVLIDFIADLHRSFPESKDELLKLFDQQQNLIIEPLLEHIKTVYPKHFFNIIYENESIFSTEHSEENEDYDKPLYFLPNIDFKQLWNLQDVSEKTKQAMWKYLQLILLSTVGDLDTKDMFGDTSKLFEGINKDDFKDKLETCMEQLQTMFKSKDMEDMFSNLGSDVSGNDFSFPTDGSNNINLLMPNGQFGTRLQGGKDSASERYIFTQLNPITRYIYRKEDDAVLEYLEDDGFPVEPMFYVPIIPMILVN